MKRILVRSLALILGLILGAVAGGYLTFHRYARSRENAVIRAFTWVGVSDAVSAREFDQNSPDAKQYLTQTLRFYTQGLDSSAVDPAMKSAFRWKCGLLEARLSILANESGDAGEAKALLAKAQEDLKAVGWVDYSEATVLHAARRQAVSPCASEPQNAAKTNASALQKPCG